MTIHNLQMLAVDLEQRITRELQFQEESQRQIAESFKLLREALDNVEKLMISAFVERNRALNATIGLGNTAPNVVEMPKAKAIE